MISIMTKMEQKSLIENIKYKVKVTAVELNPETTKGYVDTDYLLVSMNQFLVAGGGIYVLL